MGETSEIGVAELLSVLARRKHSGRLTITSEGEEVQIYLENGKVILVNSSNHALRLGRILVRLGIVDSVNLEAAVREQDKQGGSRPLGQILVDSGWVSRADLALAAEEQCVEALTRVIVGKPGTFMFTRDAKPLAKQGLVALNTDGIVLEASRRADEMVTLRSLLPSPSARLTVAERKLAAMEADISALDRMVIDALKMGTGTLADLERRVASTEVALWRTVVSLRERGAIIARGTGYLEEVEEEQPLTRSVEEIASLCGTGHRNPPRRIPSLVEVRAGEPASSQTIAAITVVVREVIASFNAGLTLRAFANFSDDHFRRQPPLPDDEIAALRGPSAPLRAEEQETFLAIRDVRLLQDGRVSAILNTHLPQLGESKKVLIFARSGDRWQVDAVVEAPNAHAMANPTMTSMLRPLHGTSLLSAQALPAGR